MREINFRAFDQKTELFGAVIELSYSPNSNSVYVPSYVRVHDYKDVTHVAHYPEPHCIQDNLVIEQFTGLYDKNGKKIYEGDVVKLHVIVLSPDDKIGFIDYSPKYGYCINFGGRIARQEYWAANDKHTIEVIGNIHENKELLDGGNNQD